MSAASSCLPPTNAVPPTSLFHCACVLCPRMRFSFSLSLRSCLRGRRETQGSPKGLMSGRCKSGSQQACGIQQGLPGGRRRWPSIAVCSSDSSSSTSKQKTSHTAFGAAGHHPRPCPGSRSPPWAGTHRRGCSRAGHDVEAGKRPAQQPCTGITDPIHWDNALHFYCLSVPRPRPHPPWLACPWVQGAWVQQHQVRQEGYRPPPPPPPCHPALQSAGAKQAGTRSAKGETHQRNWPRV